MAIALDFNKAKSQVVSILQASRTAYATAIDGSKRQFASDTEIADAILYSDGEYCEAICLTPGHPFSNAFLLTSSALTTGTGVGVAVPSHIGRIVNVTHCSTSGGTYLKSIVAKSDYDVLEMISNATNYGTAAYLLEYYFIEDTTLYAVDAFSKIQYTDYVRTASPQAPEPLATGVVAGAVARLAKDGGDQELAGYYAQMHGGYLQSVRQGAKILPAIVTYK